MAGTFQHWQPLYGAHGVPTFPVRIAEGNKRPAVSGYAKIGAIASSRLASRFGDAAAFGFMVRKANVTILDVDTPDERVLADALNRHGPTPVVVRTATGKWHAYYRNGGEPRLIRPWGKQQPIDLLGDGFTVAAPSKGGSGWYGFAQGTLDDLEALPRIRGLDDLEGRASPSERIGKGNRNNALFRHCLREAHGCATSDELLERASAYSELTFAPPLPRARIESTVASVWTMTQRGENWVGSGGMASVSHSIIDHYAANDTDALALLLKLKRHHWRRPAFVVARSMAGSLNWDERRFLRARSRLEADGEIQCVHRGGRGPGDPPHFTWPKVCAVRDTKTYTNEKSEHPPLSGNHLPMRGAQHA
jgi:hypothetical protein